MSSTISDLPAPSDEAAETSRALTAKILAEIEARGGFLPFSRYMERALYEPRLGYYMNGRVKFGPQGDFETAAGLGEWLGTVVADLLAVELERLGTSAVIEVGAGTGDMAATLLTRLADLGCSVSYRILETSPELRRQQQRRLEPLGREVAWLDRLPAEPLTAVVFANEVVDALPVERFMKTREGVVPLGVTADGATLRWGAGPEDPILSRAVERLEANLGQALPMGFVSEISLRLPGWIDDIARSLTRGAALIIDYGLVRREYYHAERRDGTLICHYRHRAHADAFFYPGLQDVSAWVDFSACADAAMDAGFEVAGFTTQAQLMLASLAARGGSPSLGAAAALKTLVLPGEMGERFKALWLAKGYAAGPLPGRDFRNRL